jgi:hypothetical protein
MTGQGNNTYFIDGIEGATLIDAGVGEPGHLDAIGRHVASGSGRLEQVPRRTRIPTMSVGADDCRPPCRRFRKYVWPDMDARYGVAWQPLQDAIESRSEAKRCRPSHAGTFAGSLAFWHAASRTAFTGDLVMQGSVMIHSSGGGDLGRYLDSLQRILALGPAGFCRRMVPRSPIRQAS